MHSQRAAGMVRRRAGSRLRHAQPFLTVPLLGSAAGSRLQPEGADQVQRRLPQRVAVGRGPQVNDIALPAALSVEALEDVLLQVDAEAPPAGVAPMQRAGAAPLRPATAQPVRQAELVERPGDRELPLAMGEVDGGRLAERHRAGYAVGTGRGDHWPRRLRVRPVARGLVSFCRAFAPASSSVPLSWPLVSTWPGACQG